MANMAILSPLVAATDDAKANVATTRNQKPGDRRIAKTNALRVRELRSFAGVSNCYPTHTRCPGKLPGPR